MIYLNIIHAMKEQLNTLKDNFIKSLEEVNNETELKELENNYLGKKGQLKAILAGIKDLSIEDKKTIWVEANSLKNGL